MNHKTIFIRKKSGLYTKLWKVIAFAFLVSSASYGLLNWNGRTFIDKNYLSVDALMDYADQNASALLQRINATRLLPDEEGIGMIAQWDLSKPNLFLLVNTRYPNDENQLEEHLIYASSFEAIYGAEVIDQMYSSYSYDFQYADGTEGDFFIYILRSYSDGLYRTCSTVNLFIGCVLFLIITIGYYLKVIKNIRHLNQVIQQKQAGDRDVQVMLGSNDELKEISESIQDLSDTLYSTQAKEMETYEKYVKLQQRLAHDIRTPLTIISGNLQLLERRQYQNEEEQQHAIRVCLERTEQITKLLDELLGGSRRGEKQQEATLDFELETMLMELGNAGFTLQCDFDDAILTTTLQIGQEDLKRIFDNMLSNIRKYADREFPVAIAIALNTIESNTIESKQTSFLAMTIENRIHQDQKNCESNGLGHGICKDLLENVGGSFVAGVKHQEWNDTVEKKVADRSEDIQAHTDADIYSVSMQFPIK